MQATSPHSFRSALTLPVIVAALGYFVDIYDLLLFGIVRVPSLRDMGLSDADISRVGAQIINAQQAGLLIGGVLWGVLGDKRGRLSVLFGSIITYSLANIASGFVQDPTTYAVLRFVAGIGLAGELGAGITLVSEILPKEIRGYGSSIVAGIGLFGAVAAYFTADWFDWRTAYFVGGGLGLALLLLRVSVFESSMFTQMKETSVSRGNFFALFTNKDRLIRYLQCIGIAVPIWFTIGILGFFGNEIGAALGIEGIEPGLCIMFSYTGLALGDFASGFISQALRSRKKTVILLMTATLFFDLIYLYGGIGSKEIFYTVCLLFGLSIGYWAMFMTITAEQFGTNLRATATTSVPNMVRGTVIAMTIGYTFFKDAGWGVIASAAVIGAVCFVIGYISIFSMRETFGRDLNFMEE
jgi:MFS family permease